MVRRGLTRSGSITVGYGVFGGGFSPKAGGRECMRFDFWVLSYNIIYR